MIFSNDPNLMMVMMMMIMNPTWSMGRLPLLAKMAGITCIRVPT